MKVVDFTRTYKIRDADELARLLALRYANDANSFWLSDDAVAYPALLLLLKGNFAVLSYFPKANDAGYRSHGNIPTIDLAAATTFEISTSRADDVIIPNDSIVTIQAAVQAATEFLYENALPKSIEWIRL